MKNKILCFLLAGLFSCSLVMSVKVERETEMKKASQEKQAHINKEETTLAIDDEFEVTGKDQKEADNKEVVKEITEEPVVEESTEEIVEVAVAEPEPESQEVYVEPVVEEVYYSNGSGLNPTSGVNYHNGWRETYYSSNVLYHYRTPEWTVDNNGVYRDAEGYVIVASSSDAQGTVVDTSFGLGKVYDTGCAAGTHDIYTNW